MEFKIKSHKFIFSNKYIGSCFFEANEEMFSQQITKVQLPVRNKDNQQGQDFTGTMIVKFSRL